MNGIGIKDYRMNKKNKNKKKNKKTLRKLRN